MRQSEMPKFGILQGIKVVNCSSVIAAPFCCGLFSDHGAEVIHVETALGYDLLRNFGRTYSMEHRNQRNLALNWVKPEGREVLTKLIQEADILVESSKGGTWEKWGLSDEALWEIKPDLVIVHVSGFGQSGDPEYVKKPVYDMGVQAFSGYMALNGMPDPQPPIPCIPYTGDYFAGAFAAWSALAGLLRARETGKGESIDVAMYEALTRVQSGLPIEGFTYGKQPARTGGANDKAANDVLYRTKEGEWVVLNIGSFYYNVAQVIGLANDPDYAPPLKFIGRTEPKAERFLSTLHQFIGEHTLEENMKIFNDANLPINMVMTYDKMAQHSQYLARETIQEWYDPIGDENIKGIGVVPKFKNNPGQIFRGSPTYGMDNEDVLADLGYTPEEIKNLYEAEVINKTIKK